MEIAIGFVSIAILVIGNIVAMAYTYGKLVEKVKTHDRRLETMEKVVGLIQTEPGAICPFHTGVMEKVSELDANQKVVMKKMEL